MTPDDPDPLFVARRAYIGPDRTPGELRVLARTAAGATPAEVGTIG